MRLADRDRELLLLVYFINRLFCILLIAVITGPTHHAPPSTSSMRPSPLHTSPKLMVGNDGRWQINVHILKDTRSRSRMEQERWRDSSGRIPSGYVVRLPDRNRFRYYRIRETIRKGEEYRERGERREWCGITARTLHIAPLAQYCRYRIYVGVIIDKLHDSYRFSMLLILREHSKVIANPCKEKGKSIEKERGWQLIPSHKLCAIDCIYYHYWFCRGTKEPANICYIKVFLKQR